MKEPLFIPQPSGFYESAYSKAALLSAECASEHPRAVHIHIRRPWSLRTGCVFIDPKLLPDLSCQNGRPYRGHVPPRPMAPPVPAPPWHKP